ncbi:hypothetical protein [[Eubacterium] cellulosolvens]
MPIYYEKSEKFAHVLDPTQNYQLNMQSIEHRQDPLTGKNSIILRGRLKYVQRFFETDEKFLYQYAEETKGHCPFCPLSLEKSTPRFPAEIIKEGRIKLREAVTFPSLFAHMEYNAITVLTKTHLLGLDEFNPEILKNGISASLEYIKNIHTYDDKIKYAAFVVNYLPPAGSTVIHPHMQTLASNVPFQKIKEMMDASRSYYEKWRTNYWIDLIESEKKKGERYLGSIASSEWVLPFSPNGFYEVDAVLPDKVSFIDLTEEDIIGIAEGLSRTLLFYKQNKIWSFNIAIFSGPLGLKLNHFAVNLCVVARYGFRAKWVGDMWALPYLLHEPEIFDAPETLAPTLQDYFKQIHT